MDNDQGLYAEFRAMTKAATNCRQLAEELEEWWGDFLGDIIDNPKRNDEQKALLNDFLGFGLNQVNWDEIAEHLVDEWTTEQVTA
jgi:hypothetical protein